MEPDIQLRHARSSLTSSTRAPRAPGYIPPPQAPAAAAAVPPRFSRRPREEDTGSTRHRLSSGPGPGESPGAELQAASSFLDDSGAHLRSVEQLGTLQRLRLDGPVANSVEALDEFLAGFVNEGNSAAPLYSSAQLRSRTLLPHARACIV